jgi:uncharacterized ion transporter superfamily protein YfcC
MGVQINEYESDLIMRPKSFAIVAMLVIAAALMSSIIPSGDLEHAYAEESDYSQDNDSEESGNTEHESDHDENNDDDARSQDDENNDDDENGDEGDSSETGTEQENDQKNVCSGWAVCINEAANAEDSVGIVGAADAASISNEIPMILSLPL